MPRRKTTQSTEGKSSKNHEDSYVYMSFSRKARKSWKPFKSTTTNYVTNLMKHTSKKLLEELPNVTLQQRQAFELLLGNLSKRVQEELATVTAPPAIVDYSGLAEQVEEQKQQLQELEMATEAIEEQLEQLQLNKEEYEHLEQLELTSSPRST